MVKRLTVVFVVCMFAVFVFAGGALAAAKGDKKADAGWVRHNSQDVRLTGAEESFGFTPMSKYPAYGTKGPVVECEDIDPEIGMEYIIEHTQIGHTWYDFQKNGAMGRMMSVTPGGYRHFSFMFTDGPYGGANFRYVDANCRTPAGAYIGQVHIYGGAAKNAGYSNQTHMSDGRSVVIYHRTAGQVGDPTTYSMISIEDEACSGGWNRHWDIPDSIPVGPTYPGHWPKAEVKYDDVAGKDYIHVVMTEGNTAGGVPVSIAYERCYLSGNNDTMYCQTYLDGSTQTYTLYKNVNYSNGYNALSHFDSSCSITPVPVVSPVSKRVAVAFLKPACPPDGNCDYLSDIAYVESMNNANDWIDGTNFPPPEMNLTNYGCGFPEEYRAYSDLNACYDFNDSLHIVWSTVGFPNTGQYQPGIARLWHWSKQHGSGIITTAIWGGTDPGGHNANIAKMSISAKDPIYHPGGAPDSVFLFATWTQFDTTTPPDESDAALTNGEIYGTGSNDGGFTWGKVWNLTQTKTPGCVVGECVSEHWSSLAQNMHNGDLHIQYVCDKHPGTALPDQDPGSMWVDNPMFYLNLGQWDVGARCEGAYTMVDPGSFWRPAMKIIPGGNKTLILNVENVGNLPMPYVAVPSDPNGCISGTFGGTLQPREDVDLTFLVDGNLPGCGNPDTDTSTFIQGTINLTMCEEVSAIPVHAVVAEDYYECPIDPETFDTVEIAGYTIYICANSLEWIWDTSSFPETTYHEVFFQGGPFVATSMDGNKVVGRYYGENDWRAGVRDKLYTDFCEYDNDYDCYVVYTKSIFIHYPPTPPYIYHCYWWWWEWSKVVKICIIDNKIIVIKYIRVKRVDPPHWWPEADPPQAPYTGHEDTYIGMMMDIDCPYDTCAGENARNLGRYDDVNHIAYQVGWDYTGAHPEYNDYYAGMALADPAGNTDNYIPYGSHNVKNNYYLYPQSPWGWDDEEFYDLASTPGVTIQDGPGTAFDSLSDRSQVLTAIHIPAGNDPGADYSFIVIEAASPNGLAGLQAAVDTGRAIVIREARDLLDGGHGFPIICGDANGTFSVDLGDAIYILNWLFKSQPAPPCPLSRADVNNTGSVDLGDAIYILNWLFKGMAEPNCPGFFK